MASLRESMNGYSMSVEGSPEECSRTQIMFHESVYQHQLAQLNAEIAPLLYRRREIVKALKKLKARQEPPNAQA